MNSSSEAEQTKQLVKDQYSKIAEQERAQNAASCCGAGGCSTIDASIMAEKYDTLDGYMADADLGLGCGLPTAFAHIKPGDTVIDLGAGAGNDCFIARAATGNTGKVIGIDFTEKMIEKARTNADKLKLNNVEFRQGDIEHLPVANNTADVIISNCVLNLVPDKAQAFSEIYRVLKPGGHFTVSDIVLEGHLPEKLQTAAEMYVGCVAGAIPKDQYLTIIQQAGFKDKKIASAKEITLPDDILSDYLSAEEIHKFRSSEAKILSITVSGEKTTENINKSAADACCEPGCCGN